MSIYTEGKEETILQSTEYCWDWNLSQLGGMQMQNRLTAVDRAFWRGTATVNGCSLCASHTVCQDEDMDVLCLQQLIAAVLSSEVFYNVLGRCSVKTEAVHIPSFMF